MKRNSALAAGMALGAIVLAALHAARDLDYWNYSEGVYVLTARALLDGADVYGDVVVAQPPGLFLAGGGLLAVHDSLEWLRLGVGALQLIAGGLAAVAVHRLTRSALATALTPALLLLTPWAVREHGALTPELVVLPLLLGAALLCARPRWVAAGAALAALVPFVKWPFILPAAAIVLLSADRRRAVPVALVVLAAEGLLASAIFGFGLWEHTVLAQLATEGRPSPRTIAGYLAQAGWGLVGLVGAAAVALRHRGALHDAVLARVLLGAAAGLLVTVLSVTKPGTGLNVLVPVEAILVPLAVAGVAVASRRRSRAVATVALAFTVLQTVSLLAAQPTAPPFLYPTSERGAWGREASTNEVRAIVTKIRACPPGLPYTGAPFFSYLARRDAPAGQPDGFLTRRSSRLKAVATRMAADQPACPAVPGG